AMVCQAVLDADESLRHSLASFQCSRAKFFELRDHVGNETCGPLIEHSVQLELSSQHYIEVLFLHLTEVLDGLGGIWYPFVSHGQVEVNLPQLRRKDRSWALPLSER